MFYFIINSIVAQVKGFLQKAREISFHLLMKNSICTEKSSGIHIVILQHDKEVFFDVCKDLSDGQKAELSSMIDTIISDIDSEKNG